MGKRKFDLSCFKNRRSRTLCTICFGLGMTIAAFCPAGLTLFIAGVILVAMGFSILRCC